MASVVDLCNMALGRLGEEPITDLTNTTNGKRCNRVFAHVRDELLRLDDWRFALARTSLAATTTTPDSTFDYEYPLPSDFVRLVALKSSYDWSVEGGSILTNTTAPLHILYVQQVTDPTEYPPDFFSALAWRMAIELSSYATTTVTAQQTLTQFYTNQLQAAMEANGRETPPAEIKQSGWILARRGVSNYDYWGDYL